jgi:HEAT repeat protein
MQPADQYPHSPTSADSSEADLTSSPRLPTRESHESDDEGIDKQEKKFRFYIAMLEDPNPGRRWKAAESLARSGDTRAVTPLIQALTDEDWRVRQKVAWALGYLGDPAAIPALRKAYRNDLEGVREMITEAITMISSKELD